MFQESESDDGEEMLEMERGVPLDEKRHLEMQNIEYGSLRGNDTSALCQGDTFTNVECGESRLADQKFNTAPGK